MENKTIVLFHANCVDGLTAAWVASKVLPEGTEYIPSFYADNPPDVKGANVYILDFSYKRKALVDIANDAEYVYILDHHLSAKEEIEDACSIASNIHAVFDLSKSGARITYEYFEHALNDTRPDIRSERPMLNLVKYTEDRDLWKYKLSCSKEINAYLQVQEKTFETWDMLAKKLVNQEEVNQIISYGGMILKYQQAAVEDMAKKAKIVEFEGYNVPLLNATGLVSELGNYLSEAHPMSLSYFVDSKGWFIFSMRSKDRVDVSKIAERFGGGGHKNAAGFQMTFDQVRELGIIF